MKVFSSILFIICAFSVSTPLPGYTQSAPEEKGAAFTIVLPEHASLPEQTAASELADYLSKATKAEHPVISEKEANKNGQKIYIGGTEFAKANGVDREAFSAEEWIVRSIGGDLVIAGGKPRGTLYGAYHFLEDVVGVRWWNPWEEMVPEVQKLKTDGLDLKGKPTFRSRGIAYTYGNWANDEGRFAARNRLNYDPGLKIDPKYGGAYNFGPPYFVHTFNHYFPPKEYFSKHPEWFGVRNGERISNGQLCLTNPQLREEFLKKLLTNIRKTRDNAVPPLVFSVSQNDGGSNVGCECEECQRIVKAEGAESGAVIDFVNFLGAGIKEEFPDVYIETLAYLYTQKPPRNIRPHDNVVITLCDTESDLSKPISAKENSAFRELVGSWAKVTKRLRIWEYATTFTPPLGFPTPTVHTYEGDYRWFAQNNVEEVFIELEWGDLRDLKVWLLMKIMENPFQETPALIRTFTDGFYGEAGPMIRDYLSLLEQTITDHPSRVGWYAQPARRRFINLEFIRRGHALFDAAERAVKGDEVLLQRVKYARLSLDRVTIAAYARLNGEWTAKGSDPQAALPDRDKMAERALSTWHRETLRRVSKNRRKREMDVAKQEIETYRSLPTVVQLPTQFQNYPPGSVTDFTAEASKNWENIAKVVIDPDASSGFAVRMNLDGMKSEKKAEYALPMVWGIYGDVRKKTQEGRSLRAKDISGSGYHWYKAGEFSLNSDDYLFFFKTWYIQVELEPAIEPDSQGEKFEVWANIKFEGSFFPHGDPKQESSISVDRVILVKLP